MFISHKEIFREEACTTVDCAGAIRSFLAQYILTLFILVRAVISDVRSLKKLLNLKPRRNGY